MSKISFFIDFDDTLFDRNTFKEDLFSLMKSFGLDDKELEDSYRAVYTDGYEGAWAQLLYVDENIKRINLVDAKARLDVFLEGAGKYLYDNTILFLKSIDRSKYSVFLLTVGGIKFQQIKVKGCNIEKYFEKCNFTTQKKAVALKELVAIDEVFVLLDDKERELEAVAEYFKNSITIKAVKENLLKMCDPISYNSLNNGK